MRRCMRGYIQQAMQDQLLTMPQAEFALSEQAIVASPNLCGTNTNTLPQLRADFTNCALPADSLTGSCIEGYQNEGANCGFESNLEGLCTFCRGSSINATDSCCVTSNVESRCQNVTLPTFTSLQPLFTTGSPSPTGTGGNGNGGNGNGGNSAGNTMGAAGLSGGQIAGIVVGSVIGAILLLALLICCCIYMRRRKDKSQLSSLNQPTPPRSGGQMTQQGRPPPFEALPGARVTRMTALEGGFNDGSPEHADSSGFNTSPESQNNGNTNMVAAAIPMRKKTPDALDGSSPESADYSSPEGAGQSERMASFKDYYSQDEISTGDYVSVLWAYQPRAVDEFELERGDMLKIVGIWDDGWATGVRINQKAEEYSPSRRSGRDSVVSTESTRGQSSDGDIKAFPVSDSRPNVLCGTDSGYSSCAFVYHNIGSGQ